MSLAWIRRYYGVPAKRGMRIVFDGSPATIVGAGLWDGRIRIRLDGQRHAIPVHPTWHIEYPGGEQMASSSTREHALKLADGNEYQLEEVARFLHANESLHMHENVGDVAPCGYCYLRAGKAIRALLDMAAGDVRAARTKAQCSVCKRYFVLRSDGTMRQHGCPGGGEKPAGAPPNAVRAARRILEGEHG